VRDFKPSGESLFETAGAISGVCADAFPLFHGTRSGSGGGGQDMSISGTGGLGGRVSPGGDGKLGGGGLRPASAGARALLSAHSQARAGMGR
jgi:hypothetical protein